MVDDMAQDSYERRQWMSEGGQPSGTDRPRSVPGRLPAGCMTLKKCPEPLLHNYMVLSVPLQAFVSKERADVFQRAALGFWGLWVVTYDNMAHAE